ncbi:hypothetical protein AK812_SmicGene46449 [Symbiodinium microadriaticum]|uniref:Uncharacterized protein n=1 Tax=Symbiodinium microadriaticum TaxID=2951 RepID=A0A1Q9BU27_SYMMI|nr:hypothetical protein AK812_SmicGene46449 [Symbiodinium microadriaticum]
MQSMSGRSSKALARHRSGGTDLQGGHRPGEENRAETVVSERQKLCSGPQDSSSEFLGVLGAARIGVL